MTDETGPVGAATGGPHAHFEFLPPADEQNSATVRATGEIDLTNAPAFQAALDQAAAYPAVTADMTGVAYCDSAAIRALLITARSTRLTIRIGAQGPVNETLIKISGLDQIATVTTLT